MSSDLALALFWGKKSQATAAWSTYLQRGCDCEAVVHLDALSPEYQKLKRDIPGLKRVVPVPSFPLLSGGPGRCHAIFAALPLLLQVSGDWLHAALLDEYDVPTLPFAKLEQQLEQGVSRLQQERTNDLGSLSGVMVPVQMVPGDTSHSQGLPPCAKDLVAVRGKELACLEGWRAHREDGLGQVLCRQAVGYLSFWNPQVTQVWSWLSSVPYPERYLLPTLLGTRYWPMRNTPFWAPQPVTAGQSLSELAAQGFLFARAERPADVPELLAQVM